MSSVNRRLEIHHKPVEAPATSKDIKTTRKEILRDYVGRGAMGNGEEVSLLFKLAHSHMKDKCTS
ncbi:hypothetical protein FF38_02997 [Lucilia cuprina]|uniref:Uncharacterized protein n=1 Tax=Lucilia cuprina TaxID=7375 RepID=A0A0L0BXZ3_LUCCU|nr:hypothetical protein FF38_02997 [Lucilia cuprina]